MGWVVRYALPNMVVIFIIIRTRYLCMHHYKIYAVEVLVIYEVQRANGKVRYYANEYC